MAGYRIVRQGDHVSSVAAEAGFQDYRTVWDHPQNADLKSLRKNPNILFPGDRIYVPDLQERHEQRPVDRRHSFRVKATPLALKVKLGQQYGRLFADEPCLLRIEEQAVSQVSDDQGALKQPIAKLARLAQVTIQHALHQNGAAVVENLGELFKIGWLDPVEEVSGQIGRLANLGYFVPGVDDEQLDLPSAIEEFQCDNQLTVDGVCGPATQAKLQAVHGC